VTAEIRAKGAKTPTAIAKELNNLGLLTPKGNQWDSRSVRTLLGRQAALTERSDSAVGAQKVVRRAGSALAGRLGYDIRNARSSEPHWHFNAEAKAWLVSLACRE
jgi:hypothetical protein